MDKLAADAIATGASGINAVDIGVGVLLLVSALLAYARGLVQEILSIGGWIGAALATIYGFPYLRPYARELTTIDIVADFAAGIILFVVALVILSLFTRHISKAVKNSALNAIDRSLGFLFGLARGALIVVIAYIGLGMVYPENEQPTWIRQARSLELIKPGAELLASLIPENLSAITGAIIKDTKKPAAEKAGKLGGTRKIIQDLISPRPKSTDSKTTSPDGYSPKERQQMERLHDSIPNK
ncbi:MAG: CvpA family protein [Rhodospirillales bacterium]|nr:CvpA family protein [Rhodospirillales bacterium]